MPTSTETGITAAQKALACSLTASMLLFAVADVEADDHAQPDILVFVADDAGWADFGAYGHPTIRTPTIDALASSGWTADNAFLTTPQCSPSRISMLSGKHPHETGTEDLHVPLPAGEPLLPGLLAEGGYYTGMMRKSHLGHEGDRQFDWYEDSLDLDAFLDAAGTRPFFLWVGFRDPHRSYGDAPTVHAPADVLLPDYLIDTAATRADIVDYYDEIARMDSDIAVMIRTLERRQRRGDTIIVFLSDNGAPMPRAKGTLYDAGIKTPLIVAGPGVAAGRRFEPLVSVIDLAPTILDWAGLKAPAAMRGSSIAPQIAGKANGGRKQIFSQRNWHNADEHMRSIRSERYKLIWNNYVHLPHGTAADITASMPWQDLRIARDKGELTPEQSQLFAVPRPRVEFYDLHADPAELNNLAADPAYREQIQLMMSELENWMRETGDSPPDRRRRDDNTDRVTGVKFTRTNPPFLSESPEKAGAQ